MPEDESYGDLESIEEPEITAMEGGELNKIVYIHKNVDDLPDSITIGTPGKLGECKVYFNAADKKGAEEKIISALQLRKFMRDKEAEIEGIQKQ